MDAKDHPVISTLTRPPALWIEHVLPQNWMTHWPLPAPPDGSPPTDGSTHNATLARRRALHTLGNLTLATAPLNITVSNRDFSNQASRARCKPVGLEPAFPETGNVGRDSDQRARGPSGRLRGQNLAWAANSASARVDSTRLKKPRPCPVRWHVLPGPIAPTKGGVFRS